MVSPIVDLSPSDFEAAHRGGHALRHACATRLLAAGLSLKEIGDHFGTPQYVAATRYLRQGKHGGAPRRLALST